MASDSHAKRPIVVERRKEKGRKKTPRLTKTYDVKIIPATVGVMAETEEPPKKRVAAYCRVSTDQEAQETSLEEQMAHFNTVIAEHPDWELAGIYADEGISGTQVKHRVQFQQMIEDLKHLQKSLMDLCQREFLHQVDLLSPSRTGVTEAEYWAQRRLDEKKREIEKERFTPNPTKFQTQKQLIRNAVAAAREKAISYEDFQNILQDEYDIFVKTQRGRYSYLPPERNKFISERSLGESCKRECLEGFFVQNAEKNLRYKEDPILIFTTRTRLRLVVDLQENVKAQENLAYALKVKISNLQKMAKTLVWVQENNINDLTELNDLCKTAQANAQAAYERLSQVEDELYKTNEQIHYAGQYLSTKEVQQQFTKAIFKKKFRAEHSKELDAYAESVKYFREENDGKLPSLKSLKKRKEELTKEIAERKKAYVPLKEESRRLGIASDNVYSIFRKTDEMKSDLAWKREWEAKVREKARQEQARQEQRERQPKRKKRSYDMSL